MPISPSDFEYIREFAREEAAIVLEPGKEYLVQTRLEPIVKEEGYDSIASYLSKMRSERGFSSMHSKVIDALTTNETLFFRDFHPFETLKSEILPEIIKRRSQEKKFAIWSAASSTGQEAYSIAMLILENFPQVANWEVEIVGTDLCSKAVNKAQEGLYSQLEVNRGLPLPLLAKYFKQEEKQWRIKEDLKRMVSFRQMNLIQNWGSLPTFDIVLIRNVMIYFEVEVKRRILGEIRKVLHPEGYLFLGASETTMNIDSDWQPVSVGQSVLYQSKLLADQNPTDLMRN